MIKDPPANAGDSVFIPRPERSFGEGNGNLVKYSCGKTPWTEEPSRLQSVESQKSQTCLNNDSNKKL